MSVTIIQKPTKLEKKTKSHNFPYLLVFDT